jgi:hypothetical protein
MLMSHQRKPAWFFYPAWIVLSVISIPISWWIGWAIMSQIIKVVGGTIIVGGQRHITEDFLFSYILIPSLGLITGLLQYLLLRYYLPRMKWWIAATLLGWLLFAGNLFLLRFFAFFPSALPPVFAGVLIGGVIGLCQWLVIRQRVHRAGLWILISTLGWGMALLFTDGAISSYQEILSIVFLPPIITSIGWWLLLDMLPKRERSMNPV